ncbi:MAG: hypothetical protein PHF35_01460 [Candidatus Moranbacteria bacterium]|nr:hypothetical protein [Candidatus Moranbacteria bacterium]
MRQAKNKLKIIAFLAVSFVVFATTFFAMAENKNGNSLFLDTDQDGLTDQEERMLGTDPRNPDTDGDGYSDGKEVESGYDPLKPAPGDKVVAETASNATAKTAEKTDPLNQTASASSGSLSDESLSGYSFGTDSSNLTDQMIGQLMQVTTDKVSADSNFVNNPDYSAEDYSQIVQNALQGAEVSTDLPEISDDDMKILPEVDGENMTDDEVKAEEKTQIEKYLSQVAFVFASNSPFPVKDVSNLQTSLDSESTNLISALSSGDSSAIESYAEKAQAGIDQLKEIETPYLLKDIHKSMLQLSIYTLGLKDSVVPDATDPMKSLVGLSTLQSVAEKASETQAELTDILDEYGIDYINFTE